VISDRHSSAGRSLTLSSAMHITDKILTNPGSSWVELFERADFFGMYKTYVQVVASASTSEGIKDW
jgi:poly(A) polymerase